MEAKNFWRERRTTREQGATHREVGEPSPEVAMADSDGHSEELEQRTSGQSERGAKRALRLTYDEELETVYKDTRERGEPGTTKREGAEAERQGG